MFLTLTLCQVVICKQRAKAINTPCNNKHPTHAPHLHHQRVLHCSQSEAAWECLLVGWVEHQTSTALYDHVEIRAVQKVSAQHTRRVQNSR